MRGLKWVKDDIHDRLGACLLRRYLVKLGVFDTTTGDARRNEGCEGDLCVGSHYNQRSWKEALVFSEAKTGCGDLAQLTASISDRGGCNLQYRYTEVLQIGRTMCEGRCVTASLQHRRNVYDVTGQQHAFASNLRIPTQATSNLTHGREDEGESLVLSR